MTMSEQQEWEEEEMASMVDFELCQVDPAPFQLVEKTSLLKVHSLFSMVGVNHAYVTAIGRLIGVVGLKELRAGIENANAGNIPNAPVQEKTEEKKPDIEAPPLPTEKDPEMSDDDSDLSETEMLPKSKTIETPKTKSTQRRKASM